VIISVVVNRYYNSIYDKPQFAGLDYPSSLNDSDKYSYVGKLATHVQKLSTAVARAVFSFINTKSEAPSECQSNNITVKIFFGTHFQCSFNFILVSDYIG